MFCVVYWRKATVADYFTDGRRDYVVEPRHGEVYVSPDNMDIRVYNEDTKQWFKMTPEQLRMAEIKLPSPQLATSRAISVPTYSKAASGMTKPICQNCGRFYKHCGCQIPAPPRELSITDFDFDEEDFEL